MSKYDFRPYNVPSYGLGVDFGSMDTKGTLYGQQPIDKAGKYAFIGSSLYKNADPETRKLIAENELGNSSFFEMIKSMKPTLADKEADLRIAGDFQARQQAAAAPYNMLYKGLENLAKIPDRIAQQSALQTANTLLGARSITDAYTNTLANYPKLQFASNVPVVQSGRYFS